MTVERKHVFKNHVFLSPVNILSSRWELSGSFDYLTWALFGYCGSAHRLHRREIHRSAFFAVRNVFRINIPFTQTAWYSP